MSWYWIVLIVVGLRLRIWYNCFRWVGCVVVFFFVFESYFWIVGLNVLFIFVLMVRMLRCLLR